LTLEERIYARWYRGICLAYDVIYRAREFELWDEQQNPFDRSGLHAVTLLIAEIYLCQEFCPELRGLGFHHLQFIRETRRDASRDFIKEKVEEGNGT
jgi:hypothetical protein